MKKLTLLLILFVCSLTAAAQQTKPDPESSIQIEMAGEQDSLILFIFADTSNQVHAVAGTSAWWRVGDFIRVFNGTGDGVHYPLKKGVLFLTIQKTGND